MATLRHTVRFVALVGPALLLAACGGKSEAVTEDSPDAAVVSAAAKAVAGGVTGLGVAISDLPDFAEVPPGTKAIHNMAVNNDGKTGGSVSFETTQTPADLVAFYRASMARNGLKVGLESQSAQMVQMMGESADKAKSLMVVVNIDDEGKAMLNLVHSRATGDAATAP